MLSILPDISPMSNKRSEINCKASKQGRLTANKQRGNTLTQDKKPPKTQTNSTNHFALFTLFFISLTLKPALNATTIVQNSNRSH